ncbi:glyoxalase domain-containing protein 4 isoform X2 [Daktulosphaira vitifoliae]|uniref:glyoxalase domain-containing protein 4 isoform X2 n=1 Tax=Daktulosphaira vitifoliae TaxID=58002 RepID=UPI0021AA6DF3|nr:glyoxalase domain-containing protein 4 isoform X2 [Daktulosphaira vitifoliae]
MTGRALHFVFKVADRTKTIKFYKEVLGMSILRHEEFTQGCEAACNGPYDNRWSKTMVGYGPENNHFVIELTYNYSVENYKLGNDFLGITLKSSAVLENAKNLDWPIGFEENVPYVTAPGGYKFYVLDEPQPLDKEEPINHETAYGRIAFSVLTTDLKRYQENAQNNQYKILTPFVTLDTPGKASVSVVIFADPDDHEICFVGDKEFRELSQFDPEAEKCLNKYIAKDEARKLNK